MRPVSTFFDIQLSNSRVNDEKNNQLYHKYAEDARKEERIIFGGRLGKYKYYDMHHVVEEALSCAEEELGCNF